MRPLCCVALFAVGLLAPVVAAPPTAEIFAPYNEKRYNALSKESAETFFAAEEQYKAGEFQTSLQTLNQFWKKHPPGTEKWEKAYSDADATARVTGGNFGNPVAYYALRMLTDCAKWRGLKKNKGPDQPGTVTLTTILVGKSAGVMPRTKAELNNNGGVAVVNALDPRPAADDYAILRQSMWLFQEYIFALTGGKLVVKLEFLPLPNVSAPVHVRAKGMSAGMTEEAYGQVFAAVPKEVQRRTDWWLLVYPAHWPNKHPALADLSFLTNGITYGGLANRQPVIVTDELWFVRKPPSLGRGDYTEFERRLYMPMWFHHEFFHHLCNVYPDFKLETESHQWFDRKKWPEDFFGRIEPDYYAEAAHKRFRTPKAQPPLEVALRTAPPSDAVLKKLTPEAIAGTYVRTARENDWHEGAIEVAAQKQGPPLVWKNKAGKSWGLTPDFAAEVLKHGPDSPFFKDAANDSQKEFRLVLARDAVGNYLPEVTGFRFYGEQDVYVKKK